MNRLVDLLWYHMLRKSPFGPILGFALVRTWHQDELITTAAQDQRGWLWPWKASIVCSSTRLESIQCTRRFALFATAAAAEASLFFRDANPTLHGKRTAAELREREKVTGRLLQWKVLQPYSFRVSCSFILRKQSQQSLQSWQQKPFGPFSLPENATHQLELHHSTSSSSVEYFTNQQQIKKPFRPSAAEHFAL